MVTIATLEPPGDSVKLVTCVFPLPDLLLTCFLPLLFLSPPSLKYCLPVSILSSDLFEEFFYVDLWRA